MFARLIVIVEVPMSEIYGLNDKDVFSVLTDVKGEAAANVNFTLHVLFASGLFIAGIGNSCV